MIEEENNDDLVYPKKNIDTVINVLAVLHIIAGFLNLPLVMIIFTSNIYQAPLIITFLLLLEVVILGITVPIYIILGWSIWSIKSWSWKVAVIVNAICLLFNFFGGIVFAALMNITLLLILNSADVKLALTPFDQYRDSELS